MLHSDYDYVHGPEASVIVFLDVNIGANRITVTLFNF